MGQNEGVYFYFEDLLSRRLRLVQRTREQALEAARAYARLMRDEDNAG